MTSDYDPKQLKTTKHSDAFLIRTCKMIAHTCAIHGQ